MMRKAALALFVLGCLAAASLAVADNLRPAAADPQEDQALRQLTVACRLVHHNLDNEAIPRLQKLLADRPDWADKSSVQLELAMAYASKGDTSNSLAMCKSLRDQYRQSRPIVAAWAQAYVGENYQKQRRMRPAMQAYREVDAFAESLPDLGPVLKARHKAAEHFLRTTEFDPAKPDEPQILGFDPDDEDAWIWARSAICAGRAWCGDVEGAYKDYDALMEVLPPGDRRRAILAIDLAISEIEGYERRMKMSMLEHAQDLIRETEKAFPDEKWLVAKARLAMAQFMLEHNIGLPNAEFYLDEVINKAGDTNLAPQAYTWLAEVQYIQKRYDEAAATAKQAVDKYPYSTWIDFTMYLCADALHRAGKKDEAFAALDKLTEAYPESSWAAAAKASKEVFWK